MIEKPEPKLVKMSRKNVALITITKSDASEEDVDDQAKLIEFYMNAKNPTWGA